MFPLNPLAIKGIAIAVTLIVLSTLAFYVKSQFDALDELRTEVRYAVGDLKLKDGDVIDTVRQLGVDRVEYNELKRSIQQEATVSGQRKAEAKTASEAATARSEGYRATALAADARARAPASSGEDCGQSEPLRSWKQ